MGKYGFFIYSGLLFGDYRVVYGHTTKTEDLVLNSVITVAMLVLSGWLIWVSVWAFVDMIHITKGDSK